MNAIEKKIFALVAKKDVHGLAKLTHRAFVNGELTLTEIEALVLKAKREAR